MATEDTLTIKGFADHLGIADKKFNLRNRGQGSEL